MWHWSALFAVAFTVTLVFGQNASAGDSFVVRKTRVPNDVGVNTSEVIDQELVKSVLFYGVISVGVESADALGISRECSKDLSNILTGINRRELWAIKALDASGSPGGSFVWGNKAWLGSSSQCDRLNVAPSFSLTPSIPKTMDKHLISATSRIEMEFRMIFSNFSSPNQIDPIFNLKSLNRLGLCLPVSCSDIEAERFTQKYWSTGQSNVMKLYNIKADVMLVRSMNFSNFSQQPIVRWIFSIIVSSIGILLVLSAISRYIPETHSAHGFMQCFSFRNAFDSLFDVTDTTCSTSCINGIRPLICCWIIVVHVAYYSMFLYDNLPELFQALDGLAIQSMFTAFFYVDVFFVLSGILLTYNFLKDEKKVESLRQAPLHCVAKKYVKLIIHRYLRFTPALLFTIGISHLLSIYIRDVSSQYIDHEFDLFITPSGFWHALLYVQNLYAVSDMSLTWSWYLASDMQFYAVVLLLLFVFTRHPKIASSIFLTLLGVVLAISFYVTQDVEVTPRIDSLFVTMNSFYTPPWMRMHPYLAGVIVGYFMVQLQDAKPKISNLAVHLYWTTVVIVLVGSLFVTYFKDITPVMFAVAFSLGRLLLSLFWGSIVTMCFLGYGGAVQRFLSSPLLSHFNKVSYMMYLLNPVLITLLKATQEGSDHYDLPTIVCQVFGVIFMTYLAAVATSPLLEAPFQRLSDRYVLQRNQSRKGTRKGEH